ncbi:MAG: alpha/beta fold hydrolase [Pseudomonadota bacterium]|nr:MAG: alpha/beta fold hydrolase [Pseudomonadota bacterium]
MNINLHLAAPLLMLPMVLSGAAASEPGTRWDALESCELSTPGGQATASARCGTLSVPENPDSPDGRRIELAFAVSPARVGTPQPDPVAFLAGGPGQSARDTLPIMQRALRDINRTRDLIFLDQRGTGGSNPLDCELDETGEVWLEPDWDEAIAALRECLDQWDADVRYYTTRHGADDLDRLREAFGIEQLNLIGGSYGTRMAQVYLRRYPERVRSVVLDGIVPMRLHLGAEHGPMLDRALERLFEACRQQPECSETFPGLGEAFAALKSRYRGDGGPQLVVTHPRTGKGMDMTFTRDVLAAALRFLAYSPETQMMIPYLVHEAATTGSPERLASQALIVSDQMSDMIAIGLNFAVGCSEDWPGWPDSDQSQTLLGNSMRELYARVCPWWPAGEVDPGFHQPVSPDVPVLLLSGEFDPVTPPSYGEEVAAQFDNARHLIAPGRGHIVLTLPCLSGVVAEFVDSAAVDGLDAECLDSVGPEPFFLDLLGPAP